MPDQQTEQLAFSASLNSARAKLISTLVVIALVPGIASEAISMLAGFYSSRKAKCDAAMSAVQVQAHGTGIGGHPGNKVQSYVADCID